MLMLVLLTSASGSVSERVSARVSDKVAYLQQLRASGYVAPTTLRHSLLQNERVSERDSSSITSSISSSVSSSVSGEYSAAGLEMTAGE
jgi:hypothetical protein